MSTHPIGTRLREIRLAAGLTQAQLAEKLGYKQQSNISHIESGLRTTTLTILAAWVEACDATLVIEPRDGPREDPVLLGQIERMAAALRSLPAEDREREVRMLQTRAAWTGRD